MKPIIRNLILFERNLGAAIDALNERANALQISEGRSQVKAIEEDYALMCQSFGRGIRDPHGDDVYTSLLKRAYRAYNTVRLASLVRNRRALSACRRVAAGFVSQPDDVRRHLEGFVQDVAMVSLLPEDGQEAARRKVYASHQRYMEQMFCCIVTDGQWTADERDAYSSLLTSPTTDQNDAMLIVSAVTLALITVFDPNKWLVLAHVYENAYTEELRQRALVGLALCMPRGEEGLFGEIADTLSRMCSDGGVRRELLELQMQMYYCARTREDSERINRDIMPTLIKNNGMRLANGRVVETDDSSLADILGDGESDRRMDELEQKMGQIMDMQRQGADVYFGGFARMKRFSFFYQISNWFAPYYAEHPDVVSAVRPEMAGAVEHMVEGGPFCASDKYSFVFALAAVYSQLPESVREMVSSGHIGTVGGTQDVHGAGTAYMRRMYLQDLYRFFALYPDRADFASPFDLGAADGGADGAVPPLLFVAGTALCPLLGGECADMARFLLRRGEYALAAAVAGCEPCRTDSGAMMVRAHSLLKLKRYDEALALFKLILEADADNTVAVKGLADALFMLRRYADAADAYGRLVKAQPDNVTYAMYHGLALVNSGCQADGMAVLYRLDYEHEGDSNIRRALAWGCLMDGKASEADRLYGLIDQAGGACESDLLNRGYAKWIAGDISGAAAMFVSYLAASPRGEGHSLAEEFAADAPMLAANKIPLYERMAMMALVKG